MARKEVLATNQIKATVFRLNRKRYYKSVGLPYSYVVLKDVVVDGVSVSQIVMKYGKAAHVLELKVGDRISFSAIFTEDGYALRPRNFVKL